MTNADYILLKRTERGWTWEARGNNHERIVGWEYTDERADAVEAAKNVFPGLPIVEEEDSE